MSAPMTPDRETLAALLRKHMPIQWAEGWECEGCVEGAAMRNFETWFETWKDWCEYHAPLLARGVQVGGPDLSVPDWLQKMALELPDLAAFVREHHGPIGWEYTITQWAERLNRLARTSQQEGTR